MGRSYGDIALNENIISLKYYKKHSSWMKKWFLKCSSNVTISEINDLIISKGWFLNITPGSLSLLEVQLPMMFMEKSS